MFRKVLVVMHVCRCSYYMLFRLTLVLVDFEVVCSLLLVKRPRAQDSYFDITAAVSRDVNITANP